MSKKLEASLKKVEEVFQKMFDKGISNKSVKIGDDGKEIGSSRWSENTKNTYCNMMKSFVREYHEVFGQADIKKMGVEDKVNQLIQNRINKYHAGATKEAYTLKTLVAAMKAFNLGVQETNIFKGKDKFSLSNPDAIRQEMKKQHMIRQSNTSMTLRATPEECRSVLVNIRNNGYDVDTRNIAYHVGQISLQTGGRISAILRLRASDFQIDKTRNEIVFDRDKGGLTRTVAISKETADGLFKSSKRRKRG
ncbi:hypothetical protein [Bacillus sp. EB600]|uniref:hypothetical protein n=1 Tax=Bacillus sp. EB600 TaxID=2806345 RepID=UPI002109138F|nr:hypothetical protein [Bacillus sp. EB600]MCQ6281600.1 hypothetical protein [Bacillus sp. EB600]